MSSGELEERVAKWFNKTGFPLEIDVGRAYLREGFAVQHSAVYPDQQTKEGREIDVLAHAGDFTGFFNVFFPVECKSTGKPWVVVLGDDPGLWINPLFIAPLSGRAREALPEEAEQYGDIYKDKLGHVTRGILLKQAFGGDDHAYAACMSLAKSSNALVDADDAAISIAVPTLVVSAPIFECVHEGGGLQSFRRVQSSAFVFTAYFNGYTRLVIRIVSADCIDKHAKKCFELSQEYKALFARHTRALLKNQP